MKKKILGEIRKLEEEIRELYDSEENKSRWGYWEEAKVNFGIWRAIPKYNDLKPFVIDFERQGYSQVLGFSLKELYSDPYIYVLNSLKILLFKFRTFEDCTPLRKVIVFIPGAGFEKSIFGGAQQFTEQDAWVGRENLITERIDLSSLEYPDFYRSGDMPRIIEFYQKMREIVEDDFQVTFSMWSRSPWGVAWHLRGIDNLLIDVIEDRPVGEKFLGYITKARGNWTLQRAKFLNQKLSICNIYNITMRCFARWFHQIYMRN